MGLQSVWSYFVVCQKNVPNKVNVHGSALECVGNVNGTVSFDLWPQTNLSW